ncbi:MAG: mucoidy inhibitor MuiA family protein [Bacteroidetes bacterium]|nr:mucoidy inhibitor MuiA family protein [Bacteroidota bacterium]
MKNLLILALCFTIVKTQATETEKTIKTKPEKIIVYTQGAQVHRNTTLNLIAGQNTIIFSGLENCINAAAIQASGNGNFIIADIQHEVHYPELDKAKLNGDVRYRKLLKQVNDSLQEINYLIEDITSKSDALATEKNVLLNYNLYKGQSKKDSIAFLKDGLAYLREKLFNINAEQLKLKREREKLEVRKQNLNERLTSVSNELSNENTSGDEEKVDYRILVHVIADQPTTATINLNYYITNAGWIPSYDLRAISNEQNVKLTYKAQIHQESGIDWGNVKLVLSTANPNRSYNLPQLSPWYLGYNPYQQTNKDYKMQSPAALGAVTMDKAKKTDDYNSISQEQVAAQNAYDYTTVSENVIETEYEIKLNYNIPSDGKEHFAAIMVKDLKTLYRYKAIPKLNNNVYLTAVLPDWEDVITMSGEASVYYDGSYVGETSLAPGGTEDTIQLSLGIDKSIAIKRQKIKDKCSQKVLDNDILHQYTFEITMKNSRATKIDIEVEDQLPLSQDKTVLIDRKELSGAKYDEVTGILKWRSTVQAKDSKKLTLMYQIKAPKYMAVAAN